MRLASNRVLLSLFFISLFREDTTASRLPFQENISFESPTATSLQFMGPEFSSRVEGAAVQADDGSTVEMSYKAAYREELQMHNDVEATSLRVNFSPKLGVVIEVAVRLLRTAPYCPCASAAPLSDDIVSGMAHWVLEHVEAIAGVRIPLVDIVSPTLKHNLRGVCLPDSTGWFMGFNHSDGVSSTTVRDMLNVAKDHKCVDDEVKTLYFQSVLIETGKYFESSTIRNHTSSAAITRAQERLDRLLVASGSRSIRAWAQNEFTFSVLRDPHGCSMSREKSSELRVSTLLRMKKGFMLNHLKNDLSSNETTLSLRVQTVAHYTSQAGSEVWSESLVPKPSIMSNRLQVIKLGVTGSGFHREVHATLELHRFDSVPCRDPKALLFQSIPSTVYIDRYEIDQKSRFGGSIGMFWNQIDLEAATSSSPPHVVAFMGALPSEGGQVTLSYPLHLRYQAPSENLTHGSATILPPRVFLQCSQDEALDAFAYIPAAPPLSVIHPTVMPVPVGSFEDLQMVVFGTLGATAAGAAVVLSALYRQA